MTEHNFTDHRAAGLHRAAVQAEAAAVVLARAVGGCASAGFTIDDEITRAVALITSWAAWVKRESAAKQ
jgi:hypothetical protein